MSDEYPRFSTMYEHRAYQSRLAAMEEHDELVDQLSRLEDELDGVVADAEFLNGEGIGDMVKVIALAKLAKAIAMKRRHKMENTVG